MEKGFIFPIKRIINDVDIPAYKMWVFFLDENLSFNYHIMQTRNKISKALSFLTKILSKNLQYSKALKSLHFALVRPFYFYVSIFCVRSRGFEPAIFESKETLQREVW